MVAVPSSTRPPARPWFVRRVLAGAVLGLMAVLLVASPASAHAELVSSDPPRNSIVQQAPTRVVLTFTETVTAVAGKVRVIAPDGSRADSNDPQVDGATVVIPLRSGGPQGTYLVTYRVISADSHPVGGAYTFSVGQVTTTPTDTGGNASADPAVTGAFPVVRWIGYTGLLLLVGAVLVLTLLWPRRLDRRGPTRVTYLGALAVGVATVLELALQVPYVAGGPISAVRGSDVQQVLSSQFGAAHLIRLGVLGAALVMLRPILNGKGWGADRVLLAVLGAIGIATWSVSGHPSASTIPLVTVVADMIHLAAMSVWLGGLVMLIGFLLRRANAVELGAIIPVWSRWAFYAVTALIVTGVTQAVVEVGSVPALTTTTYGWLVLAKAGLVALIVGVAAFSRRQVAPLAARREGAAPALRRLVIAEAAIAAVVIGAASVLVQTTPARTSADSPTGPSVQSLNLTDPLFNVSADVVPAKVGLNEVHVYVAAPDGQPAKVVEWHVKASLPDQGIEPIEAAVVAITPDHASGQIGLPVAGRWTFSFTLRISDIDQSTVSGQIDVS